MTKASERLVKIGIDLPTPATPLGSYLPAKRWGNDVFTSGQLPITADGTLIAGRVGDDIDVNTAQKAARQAAINALAAIAEVAGGIDAIRTIVKVVVFVNSDPSFTDHALVANGASDLLGEIFSDEGFHARSAVGVAVLPKNAAVEVELHVKL